MKEEGWFCPLYQAEIAEGKCLDINYERLGYMAGGCLDEVTRLVGKREPEISRTCETCQHLPFSEVEIEVTFPRRSAPDPSD